MNSSASLKSFVGRHGGAVCTSSNARAVLTWALGLDGGALEEAAATGLAPRTDHKVLFFPDQHLGRNTAFQLGYAAEDMAVWNPRRDLGGLEDAEVKEATFLLWKGHCSVHQRFRPEHVADFRAEHPDGVVLVHPECAHEVVELADEVGSTDAIIRYVDDAAAGHRRSASRPRSTSSTGSPTSTPSSPSSRSTRSSARARRCSASTRPTWPGCSRASSPARSATASVVDPETAEGARIALERMLAIT